MSTIAWFNADDKMHSHPKIRKAGLEAIGLWLVSGTYCTDFLTDGHVPAWFVQSWPRGQNIAKKLINADLWEPAEGGYQFLSWEEYQRTKTQVLIDRERGRERKRKWLERQTEHGPEQ